MSVANPVARLLDSQLLAHRQVLEHETAMSASDAHPSESDDAYVQAGRSKPWDLTRRDSGRTFDEMLRSSRWRELQQLARRRRVRRHRGASTRRCQP